MQWYVGVIKNYANFKGRARRKEYWLFALFNFLIIAAILITFSSFLNITLFYVGLVLIVSYYLFTVIPTLAVTARRLHDIGISGWLQLILIVPYIGGLVITVLACFDSQKGDNTYGSNPKLEQPLTSDSVNL
ncbi:MULTISPECIES: DUF805 domain-containing protein [Bacillus]|uniref:DUF805 domain-containing protein n=2 Tax=Bacillus TaxID=1386 RepID=A0A0M4GB76_9BACI|nr:MULTISPECIES: DUF805 domain-containing protein [Bacillus]ALC82915.1 hypothetical protein AM592_15960 [Bacillus gobiensis]MBP1081895.1 uncharacterized membrane protein YhaH (DUF805 family) [Bacillus capparidis]MED1096542.1 DUF805 domain-containing protein [Bacillus capparidis]